MSRTGITTSYLKLRLVVIIPVPDISNEVGRVKFVLVSFLFTVRTLVRERGALVSLE